MAKARKHIESRGTCEDLEDLRDQLVEWLGEEPTSNDLVDPIKPGHPVYVAVEAVQGNYPGRKLPTANGFREAWKDLLYYSNPNELRDLREQVKMALAAAHRMIACIDAEMGSGANAAEVGVEAKGVTLRNRWALAQWEARGTDTYHRPKKVADKWSAMKDKERAAICPEAPAKVSADAIDKGIERARIARDGKAATSNASKHRPKQKRKA